MSYKTLRYNLYYRGSVYPYDNLNFVSLFTYKYLFLGTGYTAVNKMYQVLLSQSWLSSPKKSEMPKVKSTGSLSSYHPSPKITIVSNLTPLLSYLFFSLYKHIHVDTWFCFMQMCDHIIYVINTGFIHFLTKHWGHSLKYVHINLPYPFFSSLVIFHCHYIILLPQFPVDRSQRHFNYMEINSLVKSLP